MSIVKIQGNASGTGILTIAAPNTNSDRTLTLPDATGTVLTNAGPYTASSSASAGAVTIDASNNVGIGTSSPTSGVKLDVIGSIKGVITSGTAVASTSGSAITFTGIPSWAKRVTVMLQGVSSNSSSVLYMQIGTSSGLVGSGYLGGAMYVPSTANALANTSWPLEGAVLGATATRHGLFVLTNITGNTWVMSGTQNNSNDSGCSVASGSLALSGALDRVSIAISAGTFDAGNINIFWEG